MSALSAIKSVLEGDATLLSTATGGVYDPDEAGRLGLSRTNSNTSDAFDSNQIMKPTLYLKSRGDTPDGVLRDDADQFNSTVEVVEIWAYDDPDTGYSNIRTMLDRCYALLHAAGLTATDAILHWAGDTPQLYDDELDAAVQRADYQVFASNSV